MSPTADCVSISAVVCWIEAREISRLAWLVRAAATGIVAGCVTSVNEPFDIGLDVEVELVEVKGRGGRRRGRPYADEVKLAEVVAFVGRPGGRSA